MSAVFGVAGIALVFAMIMLLEAVKTERYMRRYRSPASPSFQPAVTVICPCKGVDPELEKNLRSILEQDYPAVRTVFVVESAADPACRLLESLGVHEVLVAGPCDASGQKVHNLMHAVRAAGHDADVFVFCDADARFPRRWLSELIAPLRYPDVGVATGYRWYAVSHFDLPTLLRSAWNASTLSLLGDHDRNFVWGGSMALRRETFDKLRVLDGWKGAISDDYAMRRMVQEAGLRIVFVPTCLVPSFGGCNWPDLLEFTTRQVTITRVYHSALWRMAAVIHSVSNAALLSTAIAAAVFRSPAAAIMFSLIYLLTAWKSWIIVRGCRAVVPVLSFYRHAWFYAAAVPLVGLLYQYNLVRSALTRDIIWRGIRYTLISSSETRVRRYGASES